MGHSALLLPSGSILLYGGLSPTHSGLSDLSILNPQTWTWSQVVISDASMASPALAWHTANLVAGGTVVVAFGLDGETGTASHRFWFLEVDEMTDPGTPTFTWRDYWEGYDATTATATVTATTTAAAVAAETSIAVGPRPMSKLARRGQLFSRQLQQQKLVINPKATEAAADEAGTAAAASSSQQDGSSLAPAAATPITAGSDAGGTATTTTTTTSPVAAAAIPAPPASSSSSSSTSSYTTSSAARYIPPFASEAPSSLSSSSSSSHRPASHSPSASPLSANAKSDTSSPGSSPSKGTVVGASIGAIGGALALIGAVAFCWVRRRRNSDSDRGSRGTPTTPMMAYSTRAGGNANSNGPSSSYDPKTGAPLVSQLLYTRPSQNRNLSLGSTAPAFSDDDDDLDAQMGEAANDGEDMAGVGSRGLGLGGVGLGAARDPFADSNRVNEVGQLEPSPAAAARSGAQGASGLGATLQSSVKSIPFLSSIARTTGSPPQQQQLHHYGAPAADSFTQPAPTLAARGSIRRPRPAQPHADSMPGTPAELIGMAITSDDGHDALPYLTVSSPSERSSSSSANHDGPAIPSSLRPGTPLRVANPDPFADR